MPKFRGGGARVNTQEYWPSQDDTLEVERVLVLAASLKSVLTGVLTGNICEEIFLTSLVGSVLITVMVYIGSSFERSRGEVQNNLPSSLLTSNTRVL